MSLTKDEDIKRLEGNLGVKTTLNDFEHFKLCNGVETMNKQEVFGK